MTITVFGASGNIGRLVVDELLQRGYEVVAFTHSGNLPEKDNLIIQKGDAHDREAVAVAIKGSDAVISALGSWGTSGKDILASGMENIIPAMQTSKIRRIISLTGSDARAAGDDLSLVHRLSRSLLKIIGGEILSDGEKHIKSLEVSGLSWTVIRSPRMNKRGDTYKLASKRSMPWSSVGRQSVANGLVDQIEATEYIQQAPFITRA